MATETVPPRHADDILTRLAEQIGARLTVSTIYGTPVERGGVTVIPVASVRVGFGGGSGGDKSGGAEGEGGGGGGMGTPVGYIELKDGRSRFVPIVQPARMLAFICAAALGGLVIVRRGQH